MQEREAEVAKPNNLQETPRCSCCQVVPYRELEKECVPTEQVSQAELRL
jgi:hypothetical protein